MGAKVESWQMGWGVMGERGQSDGKAHCWTGRVAVFGWDDGGDEGDLIGGRQARTHYIIDIYRRPEVESCTRRPAVARRERLEVPASSVVPVCE